jgi:hypothetical protein
MDAIQNYARDLDPGIGQCLLTQSAAAAPSRILPPHPQVWIHAAQPSGVRWERHSTARPLMRADTRPYSIAAIIQTSTPSAEPRFGMWRNLFQLLAPPSYHAIYARRTRARVINYWHQGANVLPASLLISPSEITRKIRPLQPEHAIWFREIAKWPLNNYGGQGVTNYVL